MTEPPLDMRETNRRVIANFRAHGGRSTSDTPIVLITTTGRVSGAPHTTPVVVREDGERLVVVASRGGLPDDPEWYKNLVADPGVTVEYDGDTYRAEATTVRDDPERGRLVALLSEVLPDIYRYQERARATRQIPVVVLHRIDDPPP